LPLQPACVASSCSLLVRSVALLRSMLSHSIPSSLVPFLPHQLARVRVLQGGEVWERERPRTYRLLVSSLPALWLDIRNDLAICRAWVQFFCNWMGRKLRRDGC
ncbi:hypothetical protein BAE44_0026338, partial [Dichanthelium oligosanthes]